MVSKKKIVVIGGKGFVGSSMIRFFSSHYETISLDLGDDANISLGTEVAIVCVPTPSLEDGSCDLSIVEESVSLCHSKLIIIKSTVEPGTTARISSLTGKRIIYAPEYCGESSYWSPYLWDKDIKESPFFIFGGDPKDTSEAVDLYMNVAGPTKKYIQTDSRTAEVAKYVENSFYATKLTFAYEIASVCKAAGVDYNKMRELWLLDPRVNPMHTAVFVDNDAPFGGKCLPKDINAFIKYSIKIGYDPKLLREVLESNRRIGEMRLYGSNDCTKIPERNL